MLRSLPCLTALIVAALLAPAPAAPARSPDAGRGVAKACRSAPSTACAKRPGKAAAKGATRAAARTCRTERRRARRAFARRWGAGGRGVGRCVAAATRPAKTRPRPAVEPSAEEDLEDGEHELLDDSQREDDEPSEDVADADDTAGDDDPGPLDGEDDAGPSELG